MVSRCGVEALARRGLLRGVFPEGGVMSEFQDAMNAAVKKAMDARDRAIEDRLLMAAGTGMDLAVIEAWEGTTLTLRFELVDPHGPFPPGSTVYRVSTIKTGRA